MLVFCSIVQVIYFLNLRPTDSMGDSRVLEFGVSNTKSYIEGAECLPTVAEQGPSVADEVNRKKQNSLFGFYYVSPSQKTDLD